jgi:glycosyltransferase involved in cell wall biosynthesis
MTQKQRVDGISVVIPAYNASKYITKTLESVFNQEAGHVEVIVVNDGSSDNTQEILNAINNPNLKVYSQENLGVAAARNFAISKASSEYIYFLDADDILTTNALSRCLEILENNTSAVAVYGEVISFVNEDEITSGIKGHNVIFAERPSGRILSDIVRANCVACCSCIMVRVAVLRNTNLFSTALRMGEDWALWVELAALGEIVYIPMPPLAYYRQHPQSSSSLLAVSAEKISPAIEYIYGLASVKSTFSYSELNAAKRTAWANAYSYTAQKFLKIHQWDKAVSYYIEAIRLRPFHLRTIVLFICSVTRVLPGVIKSHLK